MRKVNFFLWSLQLYHSEKNQTTVDEDVELTKDIVNLFEAVLQDPIKPHQNWQVEAAMDQPVDELLEIEALGRITIWVDEQIPILTDREVLLAPARDIVQIARVITGPTVNRVNHSGGLQRRERAS